MMITISLNLRQSSEKFLQVLRNIYSKMHYSRVKNPQTRPLTCNQSVFDKKFLSVLLLFLYSLIIVMMTHFDYNSNTHPPHMKYKLTQSQMSQIITQVQSSPQPHQISQSLATLKPWYFKPKKVLFRVDDEQIIKKKKKFNSLHWTQEENLRYAQFLAKYLTLVQGQVLEKRKFHLNRMMSKHVRTRSPVQCRSHHKKMLKSFKNIEGIIECFQSHQPSGETSASFQVEDSKAEAKDALKVDKILLNNQEEHSVEELQGNYKQKSFQDPFHNMFDDFGCSPELFAEWGAYSFPPLDSYQI